MVSVFSTDAFESKLTDFCNCSDYVDEADGWHPDEGFPYGLDVHQFVEECSGLFENLRWVKIGYQGIKHQGVHVGYDKSRASFNKLLGHAQKLECLELHDRNEDDYFPGFRDPNRAVDLINSLATYASPRLTELRLYNMMPIVRSLPMLLRSLSEKLPKLSSIAISITEDLQRIGHELEDRKEPDFTDFETALLQATPHTGWVSTFPPK